MKTTNQTNKRKKLNKFEFEELSDEYKILKKIANRARLLYGFLLGFAVASLFFCIIRLTSLFISWYFIR